MNHRLILTAIALTVFLALGAVQAAAQQPLSIAFVDMERIIKEHPETAEKTASVERELKSRMEALKQEADRMRSLRDDLDLLKEGSPEWLEQLKKIKMLESTLELDQKILRIEFDLRLVEELKDIYNRSRTAIKEVAEAKRIQVVAMYSSSEVGGSTRRELIGDIITRPFVYHDPSLDITDEVIARLK
jgi:Skp family chaperone for outer membrane proteins